MSYNDEVEIRKTHQAMLIIQSLDSRADLVFSKNTWFIRADIGIAEPGNPGATTTGCLHTHADPNQAVIGYLHTLQSVKDPEYVVVRVGRADRYMVRWNGAAFARVEEVG